MFIDTHQKVSAEHLRRDAFLYVRQSTLRQVFENTESKQRQYALRDRAVALGWPIERIHTIDTDLGLSGAQAEHRDGFQHLVSEVALGHAGIILGLEVSRLARNNADWHRLLELAALTCTLILDEDGVYDPANFNDRLLLGLKGTMSEAELHVLKARLLGGQRNKARRGELEMGLPIGLAYDAAGTVVLDPDQQIQQAVRLLFDTFRQIGSATAVVRRFRQEGVRFPRRIRRGIGKGDVIWGAIEHCRVIQILHNPRYAGAYVYGRTRGVRKADLKSTSQIKVARENWQVLIRDAHPGYISWDEYERNEQTLKQNIAGWSPTGRGRMPREGSALLQGRVICGRCGARMRVRYQKIKTTTAPYYVCSEEVVRRAGKTCQSIRGRDIDAAISSLLLDTVAPAALKVALAVSDEIAGRIEQAEQLRSSQLERARYEAELARRRYLKVDPDNRLVADSLEADWNAKLRSLDKLQQQHEQQRKADQELLSKDARARILALSKNFPRVWNDPRTAPLERKRMIALLIEDVTLLNAERIAIHVRFRGGKLDSLSIPRPVPMALVRKTKPEVVAALERLLETHTDGQAADALNAMGHRNWKGEPFTSKRVITVRYAYKIKGRRERLLDRGYLPAEELAQKFGVSLTTICQWGRMGLLQRERYDSNVRCLYKPVGTMRIEKGRGGRRAKQPKVINARSSKQGAV
ncbi:MAG TPA: recombinase family protein [Steroidobacter sp.]|uniref:recombinase family protein n=1 Tax=Steroidobacter sp. TaxID=1978227 RepID=UPI002ED83C3C